MSMHGAAAPSTGDEFVSPELASTWAVLRRGLRQSPELRTGLGFTVILAITVTVANLTTPTLVQLIFDHGFEGGFRPVFVYGICAAAFALMIVAYLAGRMSARRLVQTSEAALANLRVETFSHIHRLSIAEQTKEKRGVFVSRVTADVDSLAHFTEWGGIAWILSIAQILGTLVLMLVYSWQLTVPVVLLVIPLLVVVGRLQAGFSSAYSMVRTRVGEMLSEVSESVMGASVVRAYGLDESVDRRVKRAIGDRYRAQMVAHRRASTLFPMAVLFWALALGAIVVIGTINGRTWGLTIGRTTAFLFLAQLFLDPFSDLPEIYDETQTAIAGWRKILSVLDLPVEIVEPTDGVALPRGALEVVADDVRYAYPGSDHVLHGITLTVAAGASVAIVGETGCGKTTFAKLLSRLADPVEGQILVGGVDLRQVAPASRRAAVRMVPQDGFLFDGTVRENVRFGREGATDRDVETAFEELGLGGWIETLPDGLDTIVGERGEAVSVGERQLVALARAQIASPGLLILDEATSAVDPGTERRITEALRRLSEGRTVVTIAHRLSTAEVADRVFVFDAGRLVAEGSHDELVAGGGVYGKLHASWLGNVAAGDGDGATVVPAADR
jgi:ATP-binding cassette subfamily B protein